MPGESALLALIAGQPERLHLLRIVRDHGPEGAWIAAGFVRNAVWDAMHGYDEQTPVSDVDVLYFCSDCLAPEADYQWERRLQEACPGVPWSVRNQARMHLRNGDSPYRDCGDAMCHWPELCTAVALRLRGSCLELLAPLGIDDIWALRVRPTGHFRAKPHIYRERIAAKNWPARWPKLQIAPTKNVSENCKAATVSIHFKRGLLVFPHPTPSALPCPSATFSSPCWSP